MLPSFKCLHTYIKTCNANEYPKELLWKNFFNAKAGRLPNQVRIEKAAGQPLREKHLAKKCLNHIFALPKKTKLVFSGLNRPKEVLAT